MTEKKPEYFLNIRKQDVFTADNSKDNLIMSGSFNMSTVEKKLLNLFEITLTADTFLQLCEL